MRHRSFLRDAAATTLALLLLAAAAQARWTHFAPAQAASGEPLRLVFENPDGGEPPLEAWLHAELDGRAQPALAAAETGSGRLVFELPALRLSGTRLEYFVELTTPAGRLRMPAAGQWRVALAPGSSLPLLESLTDLGEQDPEQVLLAFSALDDRVDLTTARLTIDGEAVEGVEADAWLLSWSGELPGGAHTVRVEASDRDGRSLPAQTFALRVQGPGEVPSGWTADAWQELNMDFQNGRGEEWARYHAAQVRFRAWRGEGRQALNLRGRLLLSAQDLESDVLQPQSRLEIELTKSGGLLGVGDRQPDFGEAILSGTRVRGLELGWQGRSFGVDLVSGTTRKALDPVYGWRSGLPYREYAGSYERRLHGLDLRFGPKNLAEFGFSVLKVKDDVGSIDDAPPAWAASEYSAGGVSPQDNLVTALRFNLGLFDGRLSGRNQVALSLNNSDITDGPMSGATLDSLDARDLPLTPEDVEDLIVINEYFSPLDLADGDYLSSAAVLSNWSLQLPGNDLLVDFRRVGPNYQSLGNGFLTSDRQTWRLTDRLRLKDNEVYVETSLNGSSDNLSKQYDSSVGTTSGLGFGLGLGWYPRAQDLRGRLGYDQTSEKNEAEDVALRSLHAVDSLGFAAPDTAGWAALNVQQVEGVTRQLSMGLSGGLNWLDRRHDWSLNLQWQTYDDRIGALALDPGGDAAELPRTDRSFGALQAGLDWAAPLAAHTGLRLGLGWYDMNSDDDNQTDYGYVSVRASVDRSWLQGRLTTSLRGQLQDVGSEAGGATTDYLRTDLGLQAGYEFRKGFDVTGRVDWQGFSGDRSGDYLRTVIRLTQSF